VLDDTEAGVPHHIPRRQGFIELEPISHGMYMRLMEESPPANRLELQFAVSHRFHLQSGASDAVAIPRISGVVTPFGYLADHIAQADVVRTEHPGRLWGTELPGRSRPTLGGQAIPAPGIVVDVIVDLGHILAEVAIAEGTGAGSVFPLVDGGEPIAPP